MITPHLELPYAPLVPRLVDSVTRALEEVVLGRKDGLSETDHQFVNRHFAWLGAEFADGVNRHLYDGDDGSAYHPLRTKGLRARRRLPAPLQRMFQAGDSIPIERLEWLTAYARREPTRISKLIFDAVDGSTGRRRDDLTDPLARENKRSRRVWAPSPLAIVYDFLTMPSHPGSRAFALLTLRNYLFERLAIVPDQLSPSDQYKAFTERDLEEAMSVIWTSFRPRFYSSGRDKLPSRGRGGADVTALVRHFLAMNGILDLTFKSREAAQAYFSGGRFQLSGEFLEFDRASNLRTLPDLGEIVNELWGLPIPVRGADTIFRGGIKFPARRGLVCALHGGPGSGKTSLSLGLAAALAPFGIRTMFITAEERASDLTSRTNGLVASEFRRLSFFPESDQEWLKIVELDPPEPGNNILKALGRQFEKIALDLATWNRERADGGGPLLPCRTIVVLDGLHDLARRCGGGAESAQSELQDFVESCKRLEALVILTTGIEWEGDRSIDYLVDVAMRLSLATDSPLGSKPDRGISLIKARHQLCSPGTHWFQISGQKGVRFTPQINYQLDRLSIWEPKLPDQNLYKEVMRKALPVTKAERFSKIRPGEFLIQPRGTCIFARSNVFLNGQGSGGKAGLALKIAVSPYFRTDDKKMISRPEKVLVISFLYPEEYYLNLHERLKRNRSLEYSKDKSPNSRVNVIHLYPGHLKPATLFNRVMWTLDESELNGDPFTAVVVDGIHNVFIQFPEIEKNQIFWPQLFSILSLRNISTIVTHTLLSLDLGSQHRSLDDSRSDPLRHALVQKTDFSFEIDPAQPDDLGYKISNCFSVSTQSAIGQAYDNEPAIFWHRELLVLLAPNKPDVDGSR